MCHTIYHSISLYQEHFHIFDIVHILGIWHIHMYPISLPTRYKYNKSIASDILMSSHDDE